MTTGTSRRLIRRARKTYQAEQRYRLAFAACPAGFIVWNRDAGITAWNPAAERIFGWTANEAKRQRSPHFLMPEHFWPHTDNLFSLFLQVQQSTDTVIENVTKDGRVIICDWNNIPMHNGAGRPSGFVSIVQDITARKRAEAELIAAHEAAEQAREELELSNQQLGEAIVRANELVVRAEYESVANSMVLKAIPSILIGTDECGNITQWNAATEQVFGISAEDVVGKPFTECSIRWDWSRILGALADYRSDNRTRRLDDVEFTYPIGEKGFLGISINPLCEGECSCGFLLLGADITKRKYLESQLAQAQKLESIGHLAAGIAHEINTPIQYIGDNTRFLADSFAEMQGLHSVYMTMLQHCKEGRLTPEIMADVETAVQVADIDYLLTEIPKAIQQSLEGIERVTHIVQAMKEFSHPGSVEKTAIDINHAIKSTITVARNEWKYVAEVVTRFDHTLPLTPCVPGDFNQVILNIIVNAAHAIEQVVADTPGKKGTITISTAAREREVEIRIEDTGGGIPEAIRNKIFDPFFTTKDVGKGTGQGLAIAHSIIVEKHGGSIHVESQVGKGTTFILRLPTGADQELLAKAA